MKAPFAPAKVRAFTIVELLVVIALIAILAALLLPVHTGSPKAPRTVCMSNQKQIALGFILWQNDSENRLPWQVASTNGGSMEFSATGDVAAAFQTLSNYLKPLSVFRCPTDKTRTVGLDMAHLSSTNISYFLAMDATTNLSLEVLTGDRHLKVDEKPVRSGLFIYSTNHTLGWTRELHDYGKSKAGGNLSFYDGHVQWVSWTNLNPVFQSAGLETNRLAIP